VKLEDLNCSLEPASGASKRQALAGFMVPRHPGAKPTTIELISDTKIYLSSVQLPPSYSKDDEAHEE